MDEENKTAELPSHKVVLTLENGRMVIVEKTIEGEEKEPEVLDMARAGKEEGYVRYTETAHNAVNTSDAPGLSLSILIRPPLHAQRAGQLAALTAVAAARAIEKLSTIRVRIRWVNDLYCGTRKIAAAVSHAQIKPNGFLDYMVIRILFALSREDFPPKLGDVVRQVFCNEAASLSARLSELTIREFFSLYDVMNTDLSYMDDYRRRSMVIGRRVKVLAGERYVSGHVVEIDNNACLRVQLRRGTRTTVSSRAEVMF